MNAETGLLDAIRAAQRYQATLPPPPNEASTCHWVIIPLLLALGYQYHDIYAQTGDAASKFPDYTILPNSDHTWYLEAKSWQVVLDSSHVDQAMNYAHSNGRRWVVLTNGQEWRLFDDSIPGKSADRLVATALLKDTEAMGRFLNALSRASVLAKQVECFASERRVREYLALASADSKSPVVQAVLKVVRQQTGLPGITGEVIAGVLSQPWSGVIDPPPPPPPGGSLADFVGVKNEPLRARQIAFPDGATRRLAYWKDVLVAVAAWLEETGRLDGHVPFTRKDWTRYLVNDEPIHKDSKPFIEPRPIGRFVLETNYSAGQCVLYSVLMLEECGVTAAQVRLCDSQPGRLSGEGQTDGQQGL